MQNICCSMEKVTVVVVLCHHPIAWQGTEKHGSHKVSVIAGGGGALFATIILMAVTAVGAAMRVAAGVAAMVESLLTIFNMIGGVRVVIEA